MQKFERQIKRLPILLMLILSTLILEGCTEKDGNADRAAELFKGAVVIRHIDGDTVYVKLNEKVEKLRFTGINCPEIGYGKIQFYGAEASEFTKNTLLNKRIYLEKDISDRDKYGRLLRYVWLEIPSEINEETIEKEMLNAILVRKGYAKAKRYPPDTKYAAIFGKLENRAKTEGLGVWSKLGSRRAKH